MAVNVEDSLDDLIESLTQRRLWSRWLRETVAAGSTNGAGACSIRIPAALQVRSHAQKFFLKLEKAGKADVVPPPRPKKRAAKPYPVQSVSPCIYHPGSAAGKVLCSSFKLLDVGHLFCIR